MKNLVLPLLLLLAMMACKKPSVDTFFYGQFPIVTRTSLQDSLPANVYAHVSAKNITGLKLVIPQQHIQVTFFEYTANAEEILNALACSPFRLDAKRADTLARKIPYEDLIESTKLSAGFESEAGNVFWNADFSQFEVYECSKYPFKHHILVHKKTRNIRHRIEKII